MSSFSNQLINLWDYLIGPELWATLGKGLFKIVIILILSNIIVRIGKKVIEQVLLNGQQRGSIRITARREATLRKLAQNMLSYVIYFISFIMILEVFGINIGPILAGAGVLGLAIGFGAQNLVQDIISGFFIVFEDQFSVGDYVTISEAEGTVEEIGLRTTKLLSWTGEQNVIPNGNISQVINYSIHNGLAVVDINIPYENDIHVAEEIITDVTQGLPEKYEEILEIPEIYGVQTLEASHFVLRIVAETTPVSQWFGARIIRKEVKEHLYKKGIDIPSPRLVMYSRNEQPNPLSSEQKREQ